MANTKLADPENHQALLEQLTEHEGYRRFVYRDSVGLLTVGIGRMVDKRQGGRITEPEALLLFRNTLGNPLAPAPAKIPCTGHAFPDAEGFWAIGYGRVIDKRLAAFETAGITRSEARTFLENDVARFVVALDDRWPWWRRLDPVRQRILADMCFNLGPGRLAGFRNTLRYLEGEDYESTAAGMRASLWYRQVGRRGERLVRMMETGRDIPLREV